MTTSRPLTASSVWPEVDAFEAALAAELEQSRALEDTLVALGRAVARHDAAAVAHAADEQQQRVEGLASAAASTRAALQGLAARVGLTGSAPLDSILPRISDAGMADMASRLRDTAAEIRERAAACRRANAQNATLLRHALAYTGFTLRLLTAAGNPTPGYTDTGTRRSSLRRLVDTQA